jgi:hypothetical protein
VIGRSLDVDHFDSVTPLVPDDAGDLAVNHLGVDEVPRLKRPRAGLGAQR